MIERMVARRIALLAAHGAMLLILLQIPGMEGNGAIRGGLLVAFGGVGSSYLSLFSGKSDLIGDLAEGWAAFSFVVLAFVAMMPFLWPGHFEHYRLN